MHSVPYGKMTNEIGEDGAYLLKHHTLITFHFSGVHQVQLEGFNHQNVLSDLNITDIRDPQLDVSQYEVHFESIYGMDARFMCHEVAITSVEPWR